MKVQNSKHQQYIKSILVSSKKKALKNFTSQKIKFPGISPKCPQKEAFKKCSKDLLNRCAHIYHIYLAGALNIVEL